jgi:hypothetical protein
MKTAHALKMQLVIDPKAVAVANVIIRDHADEIRRILDENGGTPAKRVGKLAELIEREAPHDTKIADDEGDEDEQWALFLLASYIAIIIIVIFY